MKQKLFLNRIAFSTALFFNLSVGLAQWESHGPYGGIMRDVKTNGSMVFAATPNGVFRSSDDGVTWTAANKGLERTSINALTFNNTGIFAGSQYNGVYFSPNNGNTWTTKNNGLMSLFITSLFTSADGDLFAGTPEGAYRSTNNGNLWVAINNGLPSFYDIYDWAQMGDSIYAATYGQGLFMTTNDGASWTQVGNGFPMGNPPTGPFVYGLATFGNSIFAGTSNGVYVSHTRGTSWMSSNTGFPSGMWARCFTQKAGKIFAGTHSEGIYVSTDNGATWSPTNNGLHDWPLNNGLPHNYLTIAALEVSGSNILAATFNGMYRSSDNGGTWMDSNEGILATEITSITSNGNMICAGANWTGIYVTSNQGASWSRANTGLGSNHILAVTNNGSHFFASCLNRRVFRSGNNGANWVFAGNGLPTDPFKLDSHGQRVFALTNGTRFTNRKLFQTTDNGDNWTEIIGSNAISGGMSAMEITSTYIYIGTSQGNLYRSSDDGDSWQDISVYVPSVEISVILAISDNEVYIGTTGKGIYKFTNNGYTMVSSSNGLTNFNITDIKMQNDILFASTRGGGIFVSANHGANWEAFNEGLDNKFVSEMACENLKVYAGTDAGIYQTTEESFSKIALLAGVKDQQIEHGISFYPNPAAGMVYFNLPQEKIYDICVYDATGKKVCDVETRSGQKTGAIDLSGKQKGIYLMKLRSEKGDFTHKIVLQ